MKTRLRASSETEEPFQKGEPHSYGSLVEIYNVVSPRGTKDCSSLPEEFCATVHVRIFIRLGIRTRWRSKDPTRIAAKVHAFEEEKKDLGKLSR